MALTAREKVDDELTQYLRRTTLRVLPRAGRAGSIVARWIWIIIFLLLLVSALILSANLVESYVRQKYFLRVETSTNDAAFPAVTVCPLAPFIRRSLFLLKDYNPVDLDLLLEELRRASGNDVTGARDASYAVHYEAFGAEMRTTFRDYAYYKYEDLFIECLVDIGNKNFFISSSYWDICRQQNTTKDFFFDVKRVIFPKYPYCFTFTPKKEYENSIVGFRLFINLATTLPQKEKEISEQRCLECFSMNPESWRSGVRVIVHAANTMPDDAVGRDAEAGSVNEIHFRMTKKILTPPPDCTQANAENRIWDGAMTYDYTEQACRKEKLQAILADRCGCLDSNYPVNRQLAGRNLTYCWNLLDANNVKINFTSDQKARDEVLSRLSCKRNLSEEKDISVSCLQPCLSYEYMINVASSSGIKHCMLPRLCQAVIELQSESYFNADVYRRIMSHSKKGNFSTIYRQMREHNVRENFVAVTVRRSDFTLEVNRAMWMITATELVSRIGGLCALFIGFTVFAIIEIFELFLFVVLRFLPKEYLLSMQRWFGILPSRMQREDTTTISKSLKLRSREMRARENVGTQTPHPISVFNPMAMRAWSIRL